MPRNSPAPASGQLSGPSPFLTILGTLWQTKELMQAMGMPPWPCLPLPGETTVFSMSGQAWQWPTVDGRQGGLKYPCLLLGWTVRSEVSSHENGALSEPMIDSRALSACSLPGIEEEGGGRDIASQLLPAVMQRGLRLESDAPGQATDVF